VPHVAEHDPEHDHVGQAREHRRVDVPVRHRGVGLDQRSERTAGAFAVQHCRRISGGRARQRDDRGANLRQRGGERDDACRRCPAHKRRHAAVPHGFGAVRLYLGLAGQQVRPASPFQRCHVRRHRSEQC